MITQLSTLLLSLCILVGAVLYRRRRNTLKQTRRPGYWPPSSFIAPTPAPFPNWSIEKQPPRQYRPNRRGPYHTTLNVRRLDWNEWIELDNQWPEFYNVRCKRIEQRKDVLLVDKRANEAIQELLQCLRDYLPARYPEMFAGTSGGIKNLHTGETFSFSDPNPLVIAAKLVQDDILILVEESDGLYYLRAGALLIAGFWKLSDKFGKSLADIHLSGHVPQFKEKLQGSMERYFARVAPETPVVRYSGFIQTDDELAWSYGIGGEDSDDLGWHNAPDTLDMSKMQLRVERQTLRRLPKTGAIAFMVHPYMYPMAEVAKEPYVPGKLAEAIRSWKGDIAVYKGKEKFGPQLLEFLDKAHQQQLENGLDPEKEPDNFPF